MRIVKVESGCPRFELVEVREPTAGDLVAAERICGEQAGSTEIALALISQICTFDGRKLPPEELRGLRLEDFSELASGLGSSLAAAGLLELGLPSSASSGKAASGSGMPSV